MSESEQSADLSELPNIGESSVAHIRELHDTGTGRRLEELRRKPGTASS